MIYFFHKRINKKEEYVDVSKDFSLGFLHLCYNVENWWHYPLNVLSTVVERNRDIYNRYLLNYLTHTSI